MVCINIFESGNWKLLRLVWRVTRCFNVEVNEY